MQESRHQLQSNYTIIIRPIDIYIKKDIVKQLYNTYCQRGQVLRFVRNYNVYAASITVLWAAVKN